MTEIIRYPRAVELMRINADFIADQNMNGPEFQFFPMVNKDVFTLQWFQRDNYRGLQNVRGLEGEVPLISRLSDTEFQMDPGVFSEKVPVSEKEILKRKQVTSIGTVIDLEEYIMELNEQLRIREITRIRYIIWTLVGTGTISVSDVKGIVQYKAGFDLQTYDASTWSTHSSATPLVDLQGAQLLADGHSVSFGPDATCYCNLKTWNDLVNNTNASDLGGKRIGGGSTVNGEVDVNFVLRAYNLPKFVIYNEGYFDDSKTFHKFIPDGKVILVGNRPNGEPLGQYRMVRSASTPGFAPGPYTYVYDSAEHGQPTPRRLEVEKGHNGGPVIFYPSAIVIIDVS